MPLIYLAGAIDRVKESPAAWVKAVKVELFHIWGCRPGFTDPLIIYSPYMAFQGGVGGNFNQGHAMCLYRINMNAVEFADLLMVHYQPGVETWGTPMEVLRAWTNHIPILIWATVLVSLPPYLTALAGDICYTGYQSAARRAAEILGKEKIDVQEEE